jgi:hypothetical protein
LFSFELLAGCFGVTYSRLDPPEPGSKSCRVLDNPRLTPWLSSARIAFCDGGAAVADIDWLAPRSGNEHGNLLPVAAILFAENIDEVALFQLDGNQNVAGGCHGEQQVARGH